MSSLVFRFLGAAGAGWVLAAALAVTGGEASGVPQTLTRATETWYLFAPGLLGITIAIGRPVHRSRSLALVGIVIVAMVASDFVRPHSRAPTAEELVTNRRTGEVIRAIPVSRWYAAGSLPTAVEVLSARSSDASLSERVYSLESPRLIATMAVLKAAFLLTPFIVAGFVLGITGWLDRSTIFTSRAPELVAEFIAVWLLGPSVVLTCVLLHEQVVSFVLFDGYPLSTLFLPYVMLALISLLGWLDPTGDET